MFYATAVPENIEQGKLDNTRIIGVVYNHCLNYETKHRVFIKNFSSENGKLLRI